MNPTPTPGSAGGKVLSAFLAGAMIGAFAMVEFAPSGSQLADNASAQGFVPVVTNQGAAGSSTDGGATAGGDGGGTTSAQGGSTDLSAIEDALNSATTSGGATAGGATATGGGDSSGTTGETSGGGETTGGDAAAGTGGSTGGDSTGSTATSGGDTTGSSSTDGGSQIDFGTGGGSGGSGGSTSTGGATSADCDSSNNGGPTDIGVEATKIRVAATVVDDGPGASLLKPATIGMQAVLNKVNGNQGICGRQIELTTRNDSWDAQKGRQYIERFIEDKNFALLVVPSSEGLAAAIQNGVISNAGIPVIGTTGLRIDEYRPGAADWVFPVSTATISIMRIMAKYAYDQGARTFGIVYDSKFKFGIEGKDAFVNYLGTLPGTDVKAVQPLDPSQSSYSTQAQKFNQDCTPPCDMVALLLVPETAQKWANANGGDDIKGRGKTTHGAQTLFTGAFANACKSWCNGMIIWTGYVPPLPPVDQSEGVKTYIRDVENVSSSVDKTNQFLEGAYLGTQVFVDAVAACSPKVTRACIKQWLDSTDYKSDLVSQLSWRPGKHHANKTAQAFKIEATGSSFNGWAYLNTGWIKDPGL